MTTPRTILVIGGGFTGLAAAYDLARAGHKVRILEASDDIGGLAGTFEVSPGVRLEKFYHHWFSSDQALLHFLDELGIKKDLLAIRPRTALYYANSTFRLSNPLDMLRFKPLPLRDRFQTLLMAAAAKAKRSWKDLEDISAKEWIVRWAGQRSYDVIWGPLMKGKFGEYADEVSAVWFWNKIKLRGASRNKRLSEQLLYFEGGFAALLESIRKELERLGVEISTNCPVSRVCVSNGVVAGADIAAGHIYADAVLATVPLPVFLALTPGLSGKYRESAEKIRFLGNVCLVLRLKQSLSDTYWLNISDPSFPFVGVIEHTNFDALEKYKGEHIAYLSKYVAKDTPIYKMTDDEFFEFAVPYLQRLFPRFSKEWVIGYRVWRAEYSQPLVTKHYSELIPPITTPIKNLFLSTMAQVYPEDRGTNYAIRNGRWAAQEVLSSFK